MMTLMILPQHLRLPVIALLSTSLNQPELLHVWQDLPKETSRLSSRFSQTG